MRYYLKKKLEVNLQLRISLRYCLGVGMGSAKWAEYLGFLSQYGDRFISWESSVISVATARKSTVQFTLLYSRFRALFAQGPGGRAVNLAAYHSLVSMLRTLRAAYPVIHTLSDFVLKWAQE